MDQLNPHSGILSQGRVTMAPRPGLRAVGLAVPGHGLCRWWRPLCCDQGVDEFGGGRTIKNPLVS